MTSEKRTAGIALLLTALASSPLSASDIENITITASRTDARIDDVGSSISVIDRREITERGAVTLAELLRDVPGVAVNQPGGRGALAQVRMRGAEANQVLVLIDGVEANDLSQGSEFNFAHVLTSDIERIEIVRGPQSALWGSDALAGVINIITRAGRPTADSVLTARAGSFGTAGASVAWSRQDEGRAINFTLSHLDTDGTNISRTGAEKDGYRNTSVQIGGELAPGDTWGLSGSIRHTDSTVDFDGVDFVTTGLPVDAPWVTESTQTYGRLGGWIQLADNVSQAIWLHQANTDNTNFTGAPVNDITRGTRQAIVAQTDIGFGMRTLSLIAEHEQETFEQRGQATAFGDPNKDLDVDRNSLAAELRHDGDRFNLSASIRFENNSEFEDANTWRLTGLWKVMNDTGLFVSLGESIKNPTFTERFGFFDTFVGNPALEPEQARSLELGVRHRIGSSFEGSASWFSSELHNEINGFVFDTGIGAFTAANTAGESTRQGVELDGSWRVTDQLSLSASYTWLDATEPGATGEVTEIRRPGDTASVRANLNLGRLNVNVGANHVGSQLDNYFPPYPQPQERVTLDNYTLVDVTARYRVSRHVLLQGRVENALDDRYENVFGFRSPGIGAFAGIELSW